MRISKGHRALLLALGLALVGWAAGPAAGQAPKELPVFDLETPGHSLQVRVFSSPFPEDAVYPWQELPGLRGAAAPVSRDGEARLVGGYLERVMDGRLDELPKLYWSAETTPRSIETTAKLLRAVLGRLGKPAAVRFLETWYFGRFRMVVLEVRGSSGDARVIALGMVEEGGGLLRTDDWGEARPVMDLFFYVAGKMNKGFLADHAPKEFPLSLTLPAERHPVVLQFDGTVHGPEGAGDHPVPVFVRHAVEVAARGADEEFLSLWAPEDRETLQELFAAGSGRYQGLRESLAARGAIRPLLTVDLGEYQVHYFLAEGSKEVRVLTLREVDGQLLLTDELYSNVRTLMVSELTREQVAALAAGGEGP